MGNEISGLKKYYFNEKIRAKVLMAGLDGAGKTTILYKLKTGVNVQTIPTLGYNVETIAYKNVDFVIWDACRQDRIRRLWKNFSKNTKGIIFVVDGSDGGNLIRARDELTQLLLNDAFKDAAFLVLINKQDLPNAVHFQDIILVLGLNAEKKRNWHVQATCATNGEGLKEGIRWLAAQMTKN